MAYPRLDYTPRDGTAKTVLWDPILSHVTSWRGGPGGESALSVTQGGVAAGVIHDVFELYTLKMLRIRPSRSAAWRTFYAGLIGWWEHACSRGTFGFTMDANQRSSTTLNGALVHSATSVTVVSTTGMAANDWLYFEDATDPTRFARKQINGISSGIVLTLLDEIGRPFVTASVVRHALYMPKLICLDKDFPLTEKQWDMWDFEAKFRTVRNA